MKLSDIFIGKLVQGKKSEVLSVKMQETSDEPIGYVTGLMIRLPDNKVVPKIKWAGELYECGVDAESLRELI